MRRLSILEYLFLAAAVVLALLGGALAAYGLQRAFDVPFRISWAVASLLLFILPAGVVYVRERRAESRRRPPRSDPEPSAGEAWPRPEKPQPKRDNERDVDGG